MYCIVLQRRIFLIEKTETASFRLEKRTVEKLRKEAKEKDVSLNSLVGQIFSMHVGWYANSQKAGFVPLPKVLMTKTMEKLSQDEIKDIAEYIAEKEVRSMILMLGREQNIASILDSFEFWLKATDFIYKHDNYDESHRFVIVHSMGKNWSFYLGHVMKLIFEQLGAKTELEVNPKILVINVSVGKK